MEKKKTRAKLYILTKDKKFISPPSPSCPKCHAVFDGLVCVGKGLVINLNLSDGKKLVIAKKIHCDCGEIIEF